MKNYHSGIDTFSSDPEKDAKTDIVCLACRTLMSGVKRERFGSWAASMAGVKSWAWDYFCHHSGKDWHDDLVDLYKEMRDLKSEKLKAIVSEEIEEKVRRFVPKT